MNNHKTKTFLLSAFLVFLFTISNAQAQTSKAPTKEKTVEIKVTGMTCAGCNSHLSTVLKDTKGVLDNSVKYPGDIAEVKYDADKTTPKQIKESIEANTSYIAEVVAKKEKSIPEKEIK